MPMQTESAAAAKIAFGGLNRYAFQENLDL